MNATEIAPRRPEKYHSVSQASLPAGFQDMLEFGLIEGLMGRRARRFFMGAEIPDGVWSRSICELLPRATKHWSSMLTLSA